jgi:hypothetical protein
MNDGGISQLGHATTLLSIFNLLICLNTKNQQWFKMMDYKKIKITRVLERSCQM